MKRALSEGYISLIEDKRRRRLNALFKRKGISFHYDQEAIGAPVPSPRVSNWRRGFADSALETEFNAVMDWADKLPDRKRKRTKKTLSKEARRKREIRAAIALTRKQNPVDMKQMMPPGKHTRFDRIENIRALKGVTLTRIFREHPNAPVKLGTVYKWSVPDKKHGVKPDRFTLAYFYHWIRKYKPAVIYLDRDQIDGVTAREYLKGLCKQIGFNRPVIVQNWPKNSVTYAHVRSLRDKRTKTVEKNDWDFTLSAIESLKAEFLWVRKSSSKRSIAEFDQHEYEAPEARLNDMALTPLMELVANAAAPTDYIYIDVAGWDTQLAQLMVHKDKEAQRAMFSQPGFPVTRLEALRWATGRESKVEFRKFMLVYNALQELPDKGLVGNYNAGAGNDKPEPV